MDRLVQCQQSRRFYLRIGVRLQFLLQIQATNFTRRSPRTAIEQWANMAMVEFSTHPPNVSQYGETSVPPPAKPRRSGARARTFVTRAEWSSSARTLIVG